MGDFPAILRDWAGSGRSHAGVILVDSIDHSEFELIVAAIERCLELYANAARWPDLAVVVK